MLAQVDLIFGLTIYVAFIISISIHEWAHAFTAWKLGDGTAEAHGRLTLNPMAHIDPVGTVLIPALMIFTNIPYLVGWAKPVPVDPTRFRRGVSMWWGMLITSLAGPASNMLLALIIFLGLRVGTKYDLMAENYIQPIAMAGVTNILLAVFNMLPVPPLDGHRLLPLRIQEAMRPYTMVIFIGLIVFLNYGRGTLGLVVFGIAGAIMDFFVWLI